MIAVIITSVLIILYILLGYIPQAFKKIISLITKGILNILQIFGLKLKNQEKELFCSDSFKKAYSEIKIVKWSNKNLKREISIDWLSIVAIIISVILVIVNLEMVSHNIVSNWFNYILSKIGINLDITDINTFYTAFLFSVISFSLGRLWNRWKAGAEVRKQNKQLKLKQKVLKLMSTKELADAIKSKEDEKYKEIKK